MHARTHARTHTHARTYTNPHKHTCTYIKPHSLAHTDVGEGRNTLISIYRGNSCWVTTFTLNNTALKWCWIKQLRVTTACTTWSNKQIHVHWGQDDSQFYTFPASHDNVLGWTLHCIATEHGCRQRKKFQVPTAHGQYYYTVYLGWLKWIVWWKMNVKKEGPFLIRWSSWSHYCR